MSFRVRCPQCGHSIETAESVLGKVVHCPGCGHDIVVAGRSAASAPPAAPPSTPAVPATPAAADGPPAVAPVAPPAPQPPAAPAPVHEPVPSRPAKPRAAPVTAVPRRPLPVREIILFAALGLGVLAKFASAAMDLPPSGLSPSWLRHFAWFVLPLAAYALALGALAILIGQATRRKHLSYLLFGGLWLLAGVLNVSMKWHVLHTMRPGAASVVRSADPVAARAKRVEDLVETLKTGEPPARADACRELGMMGPDAVDAVPALARATWKEEPAALRAKAAWALGKIGPPAREALDDLATAASEGNDAALKAEAATALARVRYRLGQCLRASDEDVDFSYPADWTLDVRKEAPRSGGGCTVYTLRSPQGSSVVVFVLDHAADARAWVEETSRWWGQFVEEFSRTSFTQWGVSYGFGLSVEGNVFGSRGGLKTFACSSPTKSFLVQEMYSDDDRQPAQPGFTTIESSFRFHPR